MTIFLDFDGVLSYQAHMMQEIRENPDKIKISDKHEMCKVAGKNLNDILEHIYYMTNSLPKIVVTSTWRIENELSDIEAKMKRAGISCFEKGIDKTGRAPGGNRGREIQEYIDEHPSDTYFIIDDEVSDIKSRHKFEHILYIENGWFKSGLHKKYVMQAIKKIDKLLKKVSP